MATPEPRETDKVYAGTAISTAQATRAILNLIKSPVTGTMSKRTIYKLVEDMGPSGTIYPLLSKGEQNLVKLALEIWGGSSPLGGIDLDNRRKVLLVMWYFYMGQVGDLKHFDSELTFLPEIDFHRLFPKGPDAPHPATPA